MQWIAFAILFLSCSGALGAGCSFAEQSSADAYVRHVAALSHQGCFGRENDEDPLSAHVLKSLDQTDMPMRTVDEVAAVRDLAVDLLQQVEQSLSLAGSQSGSAWERHYVLMRYRLLEARSQVASLDGRVQAVYWEYDDLSYFDGELDLKDGIRENCSGEFTASCRGGLTDAASLIRHAALTHAILNDVLSKRRLIPLYKEVSVLDEKWRVYFEEGRSQYIWELAFNGWLYRKSITGAELAPPPAYQWILLHPGAAVEYINEEGMVFNAVALVELIGYNRLWHPDSIMRGFPLGVSGIMTVSLGDAGDRLGWGAMIHFRNKLSIGAARRSIGNGEETTWLLSVDLGKLFLQVDEQVIEKFRF